MKNKALVVIDLQNDITKNYKKIIGQVNKAIDWAVASEMHIIYIKHYNLSEKTRTFKPYTKGSELVPELKIASDNVFEKSKASALTSYDLQKPDEMFTYYVGKCCDVKKMGDYTDEENTV